MAGMAIFERVSEQLIEAMRAQDRARLSALRNIRAAFLHEAKRDGSKRLSDEVCISILRRLEKQRRESIEAFSMGGRDELAQAERAELELLQAFLPQLADEQTTATWVDEAIAATEAAEPRDLGKVMGAIMKTHRGEVDAGLARRIAEERISG